MTGLPAGFVLMLSFFIGLFMLWFIIRCITFINVGVDYYRISIKKMEDERKEKIKKKVIKN